MSELNEYLTNILLYAESLSMPEGVYLRIANTLATLYDKEERREQEREDWRYIIMPPNYIQLHFYDIEHNGTRRAFQSISVYFQEIHMNTRGLEYNVHLGMKYQLEDPYEPAEWNEWIWKSEEHPLTILTEMFQPGIVTLLFHGTIFNFTRTEQSRTYDGLMTMVHALLREYVWRHDTNE